MASGNVLLVAWKMFIRRQSNQESQYGDRLDTSNSYDLGSSTLSFVCCQVAAMLQRERDVVYVTVAYTLAPAFSTIIFIMPFLGPYQESPEPLKVMSAIITLISAFLYQFATSFKDENCSVTQSKSKFRRLLEYQIVGRSAKCFRLEPILEDDLGNLNSDSLTESFNHPIRFMG